MENEEFANLITGTGIGSITLVEPGSSVVARVPQAWRPIASSVSSHIRCESALALWNLDFLLSLPRFAAALQRDLADVRVGLLRGDWVLCYAIRRRYRPFLVRIGWHPETFGAGDPPHWGCVPEPLRFFLAAVHAGFTAPDGSYGPLRPRQMELYEDIPECDYRVRNWDAEAYVPSDRVMLLAKAAGIFNCCVSPDFPSGTMGREADGNISHAEQFDLCFDEFLSTGFDVDTDVAIEAEQLAEVSGPGTATLEIAPDALRAAAASLPPVARAVGVVSRLTEAGARHRVDECLDELLRHLPVPVSLHYPNGRGTVAPCDDGIGTEYPVLSIRLRCVLVGPPEHETAQYLGLITGGSRHLGWRVDDPGDGPSRRLRTPDYYQFVVTDVGGTIQIDVESPGFPRTAAQR
ncbi:hypothetical protein OHA40_05235 [Nocardia sp. NBC_00508]|uniref:hypothetical protein n=1 Tax=Nocardia sp. NBC_00508 TaxID=2975992 RepID=UPI002E809291|nr:hypothetical protein [Nocardia sp. NBC_00508]WUD67544.1 hypothetical protein OHA40_05235 [Nocardia sp. NBC_00508]